LWFRSQVGIIFLDVDNYELYRRQGHRCQKTSLVFHMSAPVLATGCNSKGYRDVLQLGRVLDNSGDCRPSTGEPQTSDAPEHLANEDIRFYAAQYKFGWSHSRWWKGKVRVIDLQDANPSADYEDIPNIVEGDTDVRDAKALDSVAKEGEIPGDGEWMSVQSREVFWRWTFGGLWNARCLTDDFREGNKRVRVV